MSFAKIINGWKLLTIFGKKHSFLNLWHSSEYASDIHEQFSNSTKFCCQIICHMKLFVSPWSAKSKKYRHLYCNKSMIGESQNTKTFKIDKKLLVSLICKMIPNNIFSASTIYGINLITRLRVGLSRLREHKSLLNTDTMWTIIFNEAIWRSAKCDTNLKQISAGNSPFSFVWSYFRCLFIS